MLGAHAQKQPLIEAAAGAAKDKNLILLANHPSPCLLPEGLCPSSGAVTSAVRKDFLVERGCRRLVAGLIEVVQHHRADMIGVELFPRTP